LNYSALSAYFNDNTATAEMDDRGMAIITIIRYKTLGESRCLVEIENKYFFA